MTTQAGSTYENLRIQKEGKMMEEGQRKPTAPSIFYVDGARSHELVPSFSL